MKSLRNALTVSALMLLANIAASATGTSSTAAANNSSWMTMIFLGLMLVLMYFLMIRPQRKKDKETAAMRNSLKPGDKVVTIGGIVGKVCSVKQDVVTIETGADKVRIKFVKNAISSVEKPKVDTVEKKGGKEDPKPAEEEKAE